MLQTDIHAMASEQAVEQRISNINSDTKDTGKTTISYAHYLSQQHQCLYIFHNINQLVNLLNNVLQPCLPFGVLAVLTLSITKVHHFSKFPLAKFQVVQSLPFQKVLPLMRILHCAASQTSTEWTSASMHGDHMAGLFTHNTTECAFVTDKFL